MRPDLKSSDALRQIVEIEGLCRSQLILTARLARAGRDIDSSEALLSELKVQLGALRSARDRFRHKGMGSGSNPA
jgi:hypothetical protein